MVKKIEFTEEEIEDLIEGLMMAKQNFEFLKWSNRDRKHFPKTLSKEQRENEQIEYRQRRKPIEESIQKIETLIKKLDEGEEKKESFPPYIVSADTGEEKTEQQLQDEAYARRLKEREQENIKEEKGLNC